MKAAELINTVKDTITVKRVYADPIERDGVTIVPAAVVGGGAGGGTGHDEQGKEGEGGGFGAIGRPAGAFIIKSGNVTWRPAVDPNRILAVAGAVAIVYLLTRQRHRRS